LDPAPENVFQSALKIQSICSSWKFLKKMEQARHIACMGEIINVYKILAEKPNELRYISASGNMILKWILKK